MLEVSTAAAAVRRCRGGPHSLLSRLPADSGALKRMWLRSGCCPAPLLQYIQWRYAIGEDREALTKVNRQATADDDKALDTVHGAAPPCCRSHL